MEIELLDLQENEDLLEVGCGAGYALKCIAKKSPVRKVTGLDTSKTLLRSSTFRNKRENQCFQIKMDIRILKKSQHDMLTL
ncbi:methyltransferase domain-containing protein [Thalassobacillus pellis]|uniref:methyltransferase domain-containing protein n=1 Tax=Thalassobacillus pellis TaxID=748008 RepID=UPI0019612261|nr:class I SAM-dependent methyltransferase [Thalassobacillus pellis]MBM7553211.1 cyclopropane fatty-acyl-phospholipid synthase-like methyltransferase [Thalassobacillus pellis]